MLLQFHNRPVSIHQPKRLFISYSHLDREFVDLFIEALFPLKREGLVSEWQDHMIRPGEKWQESIAAQIESSDLILFWISPTFLASKYCLEVEVKQALALAKQGKVKVIPVLVRPVPLESHELFQLQALPPRGRPLALYSERATGVREVVEAIRLLMLDACFEDDAGTGGVWMLRVGSRLDGMDGVLAEDIRNKLVDLTQDTSIRLVAQGSVRVERGRPNPNEAVLILRGSADAYTQIRDLQSQGTLSKSLGVRVVDFSLSVGSTLQTSCVIYPVGTEASVPADEATEEILYPSEPRNLPEIHGVKVSENNLLHDSVAL